MLHSTTFGDNAYFVLKFRKATSEFLICRHIRRDAFYTFLEQATKPVTFDKVIEKFCAMKGDEICA